MNYARFNLVTLALVVAVARAGSISGGAKAANLAMAAASKRLGDFEIQIGTPIFHRRSNGVELTESGRAILSDILTVLENVERLARNISEFSSGARGHVRIWANPTAISDFLPDEIASFAKMYPDVGLELEERDSSEIIKGISENRADIGIFADAVNASGLETFVFRSDELVFVVPARHPLTRMRGVTLEKALEYPLVGLLARTPIAARIEYESSKLGIVPKFRIHVRGVEAMMRMISAQLGIGVLPIHASSRYLKVMRLRTVPIQEEWAKRQVFVGVRDSQALPNAARLLLNHLRTQPQRSGTVGNPA